MNFKINATKRETGTAEELRATDKVPAVLYGPDRESTPITVDALAFTKLYEAAGESNLIDLTLEGEKESVQVMIRDVQNNPLKNAFLHVDFFQIKAGQKLYVEIPLVFTGTSEAVGKGGTLTTAMETVNAECLPKDLVSEISVDISALKTFDDEISVQDLVLPAGVTVTDDAHTLVARVNAPLSAEELKKREEASEQSAPAEAPEVEGEKKEEGGDEGKKDE